MAPLVGAGRSGHFGTKHRTDLSQLVMVSISRQIQLNRPWPGKASAFCMMFSRHEADVCSHTGRTIHSLDNACVSSKTINRRAIGFLLAVVYDAVKVNVCCVGIQGCVLV